MKHFCRLHAQLDVFRPKKVKSDCSSPWVNLAFTTYSYFTENLSGAAILIFRNYFVGVLQNRCS